MASVNTVASANCPYPLRIARGPAFMVPQVSASIPYVAVKGITAAVVAHAEMGVSSSSGNYQAVPGLIEPGLARPGFTQSAISASNAVLISVRSASSSVSVIATTPAQTIVAPIRVLKWKTQVIRPHKSRLIGHGIIN